MTTYTWNVSTMDTAPSENGLTNVVKVIHWRYTATNNTHIADTYSTISLDPPDSETFVEFDSLTEQQVIAWVESKLDVASLKAGLDTRLEQLANPPIVTRSGPWLANNNISNSNI